MNHVFLFLYFDIWGISDCGDTIPPRVSKFLDSKQLTWSKLFKIQTSLKLHPKHLLLGALTLWATILCYHL